MMTPTDYIKLSARTDGDTQRELCLDAICNDQGAADLLHATLGISTEAGELLDAVKKYLFYGKKLDNTNIKEEAGDLLWYLAKLCRDLGWTFEEVMELNISKLRTRYPDKFDAALANVRDLKEERRVLEGGAVMDGRVSK